MSKVYGFCNDEHLQQLRKVPFIKPDGCINYKIRARIQEPAIVFIRYEDRIESCLLKYDSDKNIFFVDGCVIGVNRR